jgi:hypothetical protein
MTQGFSAIFEEIEKSPYINGFECSIKLLIDSLQPEEIKKFNEILRNRSIPTTAIVRILRENNITASTPQLYKHRAKTCRCFRVLDR